jgi:hypothetical protein
MARAVALLPAGSRITEYISLGGGPLLSQLQTLAEGGTQERICCGAPARMGAWRSISACQTAPILAAFTSRLRIAETSARGLGFV